jgi:hypothetical protein
MDPSKLNPPIQPLAQPGSTCPRCRAKVRFVTDRCESCGATFYTARLKQPPRRPRFEYRRTPTHDQSSGGAGFLVFLMVAIGAVFVIAKYQMVPALRGMQLQLPLVCIIAIAILVVLWAAKLFNTR